MTTNELIEKAKQGDVKARNEVWETHLHLVDKVLINLQHVRSDIDTKRFGATMGILNAIYSFNPDKGSFTNYAYQCALGKAKRTMSQDWIVSIPNAKMNDYLKEEELPYKLVSLSSPKFSFHMFDQEDGEHINLLESELAYTDTVVDFEAKKCLKECIELLNPLEKDAIYYEYGFINSTLKEVGEKHGVSHEWVRIKANKAFKKLKKIYINKLKEQNKWQTTK